MDLSSPVTPMTKNFKIRQIRKTWPYTYDEAGQTVQAHPGTIRQWVKKEGLRLLSSEKPNLILGSDLKAFLINKKAKRCVIVPPGQVYCMKCKTPQEPKPTSVEFVVTESGAMRLKASCTSCGRKLSKTLSSEMYNFFKSQTRNG